MNRIDFAEWNRAALIDPVPRRGFRIIEAILRLARDCAHEGKRRLVLAARGILQIDPGCQRMVGNHASEQISRNTAHEPCPRAEARPSYCNVEARSAPHWHERVAPVRGIH